MAENKDQRLFIVRDIALYVIAVITYVVYLGIAGCFAYRTFHPQEISIPESISVNIVDSKEKKKELSAEGKGYLKEQLHTALMEVSGKAESAYNEKFATLLTILAVFGVAWPVIIGLLQLRFNEKELQKIDNSVQESHNAQEKAENALKEMHEQRAKEYALFADLSYDMGFAANKFSQKVPTFVDDDAPEEPIIPPGDFFFVRAIKYRLHEAETDISRFNTSEMKKAREQISETSEEKTDRELLDCIEFAKRIKTNANDPDIKSKVDIIIKDLISTGVSRKICDEAGLPPRTEDQQDEKA